jgi:hypothetical protein
MTIHYVSLYDIRLCVSLICEHFHGFFGLSINLFLFSEAVSYAKITCNVTVKSKRIRGQTVRLKGKVNCVSKFAFIRLTELRRNGRGMDIVIQK